MKTIKSGSHSKSHLSNIIYTSQFRKSVMLNSFQHPAVGMRDEILNQVQDDKHYSVMLNLFQHPVVNRFKDRILNQVQDDKRAGSLGQVQGNRFAYVQGVQNHESPSVMLNLFQHPVVNRFKDRILNQVQDDKRAGSLGQVQNDVFTHNAGLSRHAGMAQVPNDKRAKSATTPKIPGLPHYSAYNPAFGGSVEPFISSERRWKR